MTLELIIRYLCQTIIQNPFHCVRQNKVTCVHDFMINDIWKRKLQCVSQVNMKLLRKFFLDL